MIPQDFIQQLLDRVDIVEVVDRYVPLKRKGANYQACCPFHAEKTPSFTVSPTKQFYHCFGCGAHGTVISFLMNHGGLGFVDAVHELAGRVGLQVPDDGPAGRDERPHAPLFEVLDVAARFYREQLKLSPAAVEYLRQRGLDGETAAAFGLGFAPDDWQALARALPDYGQSAVEAAGLVVRNEGRRYDRFRGRVMFPIRNERGKVIAFGGRVLGSGEPKYLNSPETPLFHKGRELYGLFEQRRGIQRAGRAVVVEGYMDVVMLARHGVDHALATLGTAVTAEHLARVFRLVDDVVFAFDGDAAGRKAAWRALENSLPQLQDGKRAAFVFLPEGEDPDSFVRKAGRDAFERLCEEAIPLSEFFFQELQGRAPPDSEEGRVRLHTIAEPFLRQLDKAPLLARVMRRRLAELTGLASPGKPIRASPARPATVSRTQDRASVARVILQAILHRPALLAQLPEPPLTGDADVAHLSTILVVLREHPELASVPALSEHFRGRPEADLVNAAAAGLLGWGEQDDVEADLSGAWATLNEQAARLQAAALSRMKLSEIPAEERARYLAALRDKKLDRLRAVKADD